MRFVFLILSVFGGFNVSAHDYRATYFNCSSDLLTTLILKTNETTDELILMSFTDDEAVWLADAVTVNGNEYAVDLVHPTNVATGTVAEQSMLTKLNFTLPAKRMVRRVQTGGYYMPIYSTYPARFLLDLTATTINGATKKISVACTGW